MHACYQLLHALSTEKNHCSTHIGMHTERQTDLCKQPLHLWRPIKTELKSNLSLSLSLCMQYYECTFWPIDRSMHYAFVCLASCTTIYLSLFIFVSTVSGSNYTCCVCLVKLYICMQLVARLVTFSLEIVGKTESPQSLSPIMVQSRCRTLAYCMALLPATTLRNYYHLFV